MLVRGLIVNDDLPQGCSQGFNGLLSTLGVSRC
jgi:hypothetical protein